MKATPVLNGNGAAPATAVVARPPRPKPRKPELREPRTLLEAIVCAASDPAIDIGKIEHLIRLRREMEQAEAEHAFNNALAAAQAQMVPIAADAVNDQIGNRYASYAALDRAVRPIYTQHGLAMTYATGERSTDVAVEVCGWLIGHGHSRRYSIVMPADGKGARGGDVMSRTHAAASAISYGMRYLLVMAFNLAIDRDDDGNAAGPRKSSAQLKRDGEWPKFEGEMRACTSMSALQSVWERWQSRMNFWSRTWLESAVNLKESCKEALGGTLRQLEESAEALEADRWRRGQSPRALPIKTTMWREGE
ncbi:MAG TPA: ERF family protein [Hyphomicrobiaceae bacterium]